MSDQPGTQWTRSIGAALMNQSVCVRYVWNGLCWSREGAGKLICTLSFWATTKRNTMTDRMRCNKGIQCDLATVTSNLITKKQGDHHILLSTENRTISNRNKDIQTCLDYLKKK